MTPAPGEGVSPGRPPRLPQLLLERLGGRRGAYMLGDLNEEYLHFMLPERGRRRARFWYWRQVARSLPNALLGPSARGQPPARRRRARLQTLPGDIRIATRNLVRSPRFSLAVIFTLGIGVGAGASVFAVVDLLLFRPPPHVDDPERVRRLALHENRPPFGEFVSSSLAWVDYEAMRTGTTTLDAVAAWFSTQRSLGRGAGARNIAVTLVTPSFFPLLGVAPAFGRFFTEQEDVIGLNPAPCIASDTFWRQELGGGRDALGRELTVGGMSCTVVGVTPKGFNGFGLTTVHLWLPIRAGTFDAVGRDSDIWTTDRRHWVRVLARLAPGASEAVAAQDATAAYRAFTTRRRDPNLVGVAEWQSIMPGRSTRRTVTNTSSLLLAGGAVLLLLITVNLANLFVVRDLGRARETAIRLALGSPRWRLFGSRVAEAGMLALAAGTLGLTVAAGLGPIVRATLIGAFNFAASAVTLRVGIVTVGIALSIGIAIAAVSTVRLSWFDPAALLANAGTLRSGGGRRANALRLGLVAIQAALSVALLVAAAAFVNSFRRAAGLDLGFDRRNVAVASVRLSDLNYSTAEQQDFYRGLWERAQNLPGIASASLGYMTPWYNNGSERIVIPGRDSLPPAPGFGRPAFDAVTPEYLTTMRLTLRAGRWISDGDTPGSAPVVVINEALRDLYWRSEVPLGRCMHIGDNPDTPCREVVGIVANHRFTGDLEQQAIAAYFLPLAQSGEYNVVPRLMVRTIGDAKDAVPVLRQLVQGAAPNLPAAQILLIKDLFEPYLAQFRIGSYAFTALGLLATVVGAVGLFSVLSYVVVERRREFAIRAAIGATSRQIGVPVVRQGLTAVIAGLGAGFGLVVLAAGWIQPLLFRTTMMEAQTLAAVGGVSLLVALTATIAPAREAAGRSPMETLRED